MVKLCLTGKLQANQTVLYPNTLTTGRHLSISHLACVVANKLEYGFCARIHNTMRMWVKGRVWTGYHGVNTFQWYWLLQSWNHLLQCLGTLPQSSQAGTRRPPRLSKGRAAALQRKSGAPFACWMLTYMQGWCSLACCGKVCESACCTSDWNKEDLEHRGRKSRRLRAKNGAGRAEERREHTPVRCFRNLSFILRSRGTISTRGEKSYYSNKAPTKCDAK